MTIRATPFTNYEQEVCKLPDTPSVTMLYESDQARTVLQQDLELVKIRTGGWRNERLTTVSTTNETI